MADGFVCEAVSIPPDGFSADAIFGPPKDPEYVRRPALVSADCRICRNQFSYVRAERGRKRHYCSDACRDTGLINYRQAYNQAAVRKEAVRNRKFRDYVCKWCKTPFRSQQSKASYCSSECSRAGVGDAVRLLQAKPLRQCEKCGQEFRPSKRSRRQRLKGQEQRFCSATCAGAGKPKGWNRQDRISKGRTIYGWGGVNPLKVLTRDGWRCHLCGVKTPRRLRGTTDPLAPEVDHIVPISAGGAHTMENCACACRRCNLEKGSRPLGQMRLFA